MQDSDINDLPAPSERIPVLAIVAALAAGGPLPPPAAPWLGGAVVTVLLWGVWQRSLRVVHLGLVAILSGTVVRIPWLVALWPLPLAVFLSVYAAALALMPRLRHAPEATGWLRLGRVNRNTLLLLALFIIISAIALVCWRVATRRDLSPFARLVPDLPLSLLVPGILLFACLNAAFEELVWRGAVQHALKGTLASSWGACWLQAAAFGLWHFNGFPGGWIGVLLAGSFAGMMGILRQSGRGMLAPWLGHVAADMTISGLVLAMVLGAG